VLPTGRRRIERRRFDADEAPRESRTTLFDVSVGLVEDLHRHAARDKGPEAFCPVFQVCLPYRGVFVWHVGGEAVVGDANQAIFVRASEGYHLSNPFAEGYAELIFTPHWDVLSELAYAHGTPPGRHPLFRQRRARAHGRLQVLRARFLHWARSGHAIDQLEADEAMLEILREAFRDAGTLRDQCGWATARLIRRTKVFLEAELPNRILLADVGRAVGASPTYLTDVFRRVEGASLHQYLTQLRLARALIELPHTNDLTRLALDVGFSSHSHFSAAFRRAFGCTPSQYRHSSRGPYFSGAGLARESRGTPPSMTSSRT